MLYGGGNFTHCGADVVRYVAWLDNSNTGVRTALGGPPLDAAVWALTPLEEQGQGCLVAGRGFTECDGAVLNAVARWDGAAWHPLADGFTWESEPGVFLPGTLYALYVFQDELYAGGAFTHSGMTEVNHLARWNGSRWEAVAGGFDAPVMAIGEFPGELVAGGHFVSSGDELVFYIAHLSDGDWEGYYNGTNAALFAITNFDGRLVVGGEFNEAGGFDCSHIISLSAPGAMANTGFNSRFLRRPRSRSICRTSPVANGRAAARAIGAGLNVSD